MRVTVRLNSSVELGWVAWSLRMLGWCKLDSVRDSALKLAHTKQTSQGRHDPTVKVLTIESSSLSCYHLIDPTFIWDCVSREIEFY